MSRPIIDMRSTLIGLLSLVTIASTEWMHTPRYGANYVGGFQIANESSMQRRTVRCTPCDDSRNNNPPNSIDDYRGNGADNLGYDWSPKAWGGPAFPNKSKASNRPGNDWSGDRGSRQMPADWGVQRQDRCPGCNSDKRNWDGYTERPRDYDNRWDRDRRNWGSSTTRPDSTQGNEATVTSSVLGIRNANDKRLPVSWQGDGRSMRWDGFRNGMSWEQSDTMEKRMWNDDRAYNHWDGNPKDSSNWDDKRKGYYAPSWSYGPPQSQSWNTMDSKWNRPWTPQDRRPDDKAYGQSSSLPFGSTYPNSNPYPSASNYPSDRPGYPSNSWISSTTPYPPNNQYLQPTTSRPYSQYPNSQRPYEVPVRPEYQPSNNYQPQRPPYNSQNGGSWNYDRPGQWTTARPSQNYLPQSPRPPLNPSYDQRPPIGVPSITIWNGRPSDYDRPGSKPSKGGYYTGFITEIHDSNYLGGNRYPNDRPSSGYPYNNRFPSTDRYPDANRYPSSSWVGTDKDRHPGGDKDRYPNNDRDHYPNYERPSYGNRYDRPGDYDKYDQRPNDKNPWYNQDRNKPNYDNRFPTDNNRYPNNDRYPNYDQNKRPSYDSDRNPSYNNDNRYPNYDKDRYPNRPESSDHDRGPNPAADSGSWNYGEDGNKDGTYRRSGGSYPSYKGGKYYTSSYLASASTPASSNDFEAKKPGADETTPASSQER